MRYGAGLPLDAPAIPTINGPGSLTLIGIEELKTGSGGFNEAAAIRCGTLRWRRVTRPISTCFNEAAAIRCGTQAMSPTILATASVLQ